VRKGYFLNQETVPLFSFFIKEEKQIARNKKRKKSRRPGLTEEQKKIIQKNKRKYKRQEFIYSTIFVIVMIPLFSLDTFAYDLFYDYGWNVAILDVIYIIIELLFILLFFLIGCLMVWVLYFLIKAFKESKQQQKTTVKSFLLLSFAFLIILGVGFFFFFWSIGSAISYIQYFF
jgi:hypothetical protein